MAILQILSPVFYIIVAAIIYRISVPAAFNEIWALTPELRKFEIFFLPLVLGGLVLMTKKTGYYVVILGTIYLIVRGVMEFVASNETDPVFPIVISNIVCLVVVATLLRPKTRSVYFNPRLRWWETSPRYIVAFAASVTRIGGQPMKATMQNIATGGAGLETADTGYLNNEIVDLQFQHEGESYALKSKVVWEKSSGTGRQYVGIQWADDNSSAEWAKLRRLIRALKTKRTPTTRSVPHRLSDVKEWFAKLAG